MSYFYVIYLCIYFLIILYYAVLGCWMLAFKDNLVCTRGEHEAKLRMTRSVGVFMFLWALEYFLCLPLVLRFYDISHPSYKLYFISTSMLHIPMLYVVIRAILQKWEGTLRGAGILGLMFLIIDIWFILFDWNSWLPVKAAGILSFGCVVGFIVKYHKDYSNYVFRLQSEYSETSRRDVFWSCWSFMGFAVQMLVYLLYVAFWNLPLETLYMSLSIINAGVICYFTRKQRAMDNDIVNEELEKEVVKTPVAVASDENSKEKAFYDVVEDKLKSLCEKNLLFLEPDLTRETLCLRLSIGRTYLSMYLRSRGLTFYQYINSLRVEYAIKMMEENPELPITEVCKYSGFRSQTTFRKVFQEMMGCLPSELNSKKVKSPKASQEPNEIASGALQ